ncbi:MAG TPA: adenylate/guanylate cyclase domain-containing protein [Armatimonadetes bacterium]|nr:adenylate/guanylate cyclase domain-containing protein [Armatimonadota bacterium]
MKILLANRLDPRRWGWLGVALVNGGLTVLLFAVGALQWLELKAIDWRFRLRGPEPPPEEIVLVGVDQHSFDELQQRWPWPRSWHALVIDRLRAAGAAVIVLDFLLSEPSEAPEDQALVEALARAGNVVLPREITPEQQHVACLPRVAQAAAGEGYVNFHPDQDGIVRQQPLLFVVVEGDTEQVFLPLGVEVACLYRNLPAEIDLSQPGAVRLGSLTVPLDRSGNLRINFVGGSGSFPLYSYADVLAGRVTPETFARKIVFIGLTDPTYHDYYRTPFRRSAKPFAVPAGAEVSPSVSTSSIEIHANLARTILQECFLRQPPKGFTYGLVLLLAFLLAFAWGRMENLWAERLSFLAALALVGLGGQLAFRHGWLLDLMPLWGVTLLTYGGHLSLSLVVERLRRQQVTEMFGKYLPRPVADWLVKHPESLRLGGERQEITILFADIRGFTTLAEARDPEEVVDLLNDYFNAVGRVIQQYEGLIYKFVGDEVMVLFNTPRPQEDHVLRAVQVGLDMQAAVAQLRQRWQKQGRPDLHIGVGITRGPVVVGNVGFEDHLDYTAIGDPVNLAARLCGSAEPDQVLVDEQVYEVIRQRVVAKDLGTIPIKGKTEAVRVYAVGKIKGV